MYYNKYIYKRNFIFIIVMVRNEERLKVQK